MKDFVEFVAKGLVDKPGDVQVVEVEGEQGAVLELRVAKEDLGKVEPPAGAGFPASILPPPLIPIPIRWGNPAGRGFRP